MDEQRQLAEQIATAAQRQRIQVAIAESLTGGMIATRLAAAPDASSWFRGALVAYASQVKHQLLHVPPGPVVSEAAAAAMCTGVAALLDADVALAITGVGGPDPQDGQPPGTVWLAACRAGQQRTELHHFHDNEPAAICHHACTKALQLLTATLTG